MFISKTIYTKTAFEAINEYISNNSTNIIKSQTVPALLNRQSSCFVTLKTDTGELRGCIGTIKPVYKNLYIEIINNAVSAAFFDSRFGKLTKKELGKIIISVEVLSPPELIKDISMLNPKVYGAIISDNYNRRGVLLPKIEGVETVDEQIRIIKRKAGIIQNGIDNLEIYRFKTEKFY
ncbi:MAG: AmmeMemoRadiSam system protein A [Bacteroidales bacterium]|nr:AmmeMemoRadiSam system protein A [Bacteroidales bacterium]